MHFSCTLVGDGPSDRSLLPVIEWVLLGNVRRRGGDLSFSVNFFSSADAKSHDLSLKVSRALDLYPCHILFIHRDAEHPDRYQGRMKEIAGVNGSRAIAVVPVVPIRMTEAWMLISEQAVRRAANNPNGRQQIALPPVARLEGLVDPKETLLGLLRTASGLGQRRLRSFNEGRAKARVADLIDDFSDLRALRSFSEFEARANEALGLVLRGV